MPYLLIRTNSNVPAEKQEILLRKGSSVVATALGKPERYVMASLESDIPMLFDANDKPCAYLELKSIGLPSDQTKEFSHTLCDLISEELGIATDRIYIEFSDAPRHMWGWNGSTF